MSVESRNRYAGMVYQRNFIIVCFFAMCTPSVSLAASCSLPLNYTVGNVDTRFGITIENLVHDLSLAESVWEKRLEKNIFSYGTTSGAVRVNLVYDTRQKVIDSNRKTIEQLAVITSAFDVIRPQFDAVASSTKNDQAKNNAYFVVYKADETQFNSEVAGANARGGASQSEYQSFAARKDALKIRFDQLKSEQDAVNDRVLRLNALSGLLNQLASAINLYSSRYNAEQIKIGEVEEGVYAQYGRVRTITIFAFADQNQLIRVLAHELGHAVGLDHVSLPDAIMYRSNTSKELIATTADVEEFKRVCE